MPAPPKHAKSGDKQAGGSGVGTGVGAGVGIGVGGAGVGGAGVGGAGVGGAGVGGIGGGVGGGTGVRGAGVGGAGVGTATQQSVLKSVHANPMLPHVSCLPLQLSRPLFEHTLCRQLQPSVSCSTITTRQNARYDAPLMWTESAAQVLSKEAPRGESCLVIFQIPPAYFNNHRRNKTGVIYATNNGRHRQPPFTFYLPFPQMCRFRVN
jgi:hypothetical protein